MLTVAPPAKVMAKRGGTADGKISVSLLPGYHVNSHTPSEEFLIPLTLKWSGGALQTGEVVFPKPSQEKYEFSDKPLSVYTGNFELVTHFRVPAKAPGGPGSMLGKLRYQACNNNACFPPKTVDVTLPYSIQ